MSAYLTPQYVFQKERLFPSGISYFVVPDQAGSISQIVGVKRPGSINKSYIEDVLRNSVYSWRNLINPKDTDSDMFTSSAIYRLALMRCSSHDGQPTPRTVYGVSYIQPDTGAVLYPIDTNHQRVFIPGPSGILSPFWPNVVYEINNDIFQKVQNVYDLFDRFLRFPSQDEDDCLDTTNEGKYIRTDWKFDYELSTLTLISECHVQDIIYSTGDYSKMKDSSGTFSKFELVDESFDVMTGMMKSKWKLPLHNTQILQINEDGQCEVYFNSSSGQVQNRSTEYINRRLLVKSNRLEPITSHMNDWIQQLVHDKDVYPLSLPEYQIDTNMFISTLAEQIRLTLESPESQGNIVRCIADLRGPWIRTFGSYTNTELCGEYVLSMNASDNLGGSIVVVFDVQHIAIDMVAEQGTALFGRQYNASSRVVEWPQSCKLSLHTLPFAIHIS